MLRADDQPLILVRSYVQVGDEDATPSLPLGMETATSLLSAVGVRYIVRRMNSSEALTVRPSWLDAFRERPQDIETKLSDGEISYALKVSDDARWGGGGMLAK